MTESRSPNRLNRARVSCLSSSAGSSYSATCRSRPGTRMLGGEIYCPVYGAHQIRSYEKLLKSSLKPLDWGSCDARLSPSDAHLAASSPPRLRPRKVYNRVQKLSGLQVSSIELYTIRRICWKGRSPRSSSADQVETPNNLRTTSCSLSRARRHSRSTLLAASLRSYNFS